MQYKKYITVYCSSSNNIAPEYIQCGVDVALALTQNEFGIVYGGGQQGIMGKLAKTAIQAHGSVIGIIPEQLIDTEKPYTDATELIYVENLRERKRLLEERGDAYLVLPGGFGTFDEMFETLTLKVVGMIDKPFVILNIFNFYAPLIEYLTVLNEKGFMHLGALTHFTVCNTIEEMITYFKDQFKR